MKEDWFDNIATNFDNVVGTAIEDIIAEHYDPNYEHDCELLDSIREALTGAFNGCYVAEDDDDNYCFEGECPYGCENCPYKIGVEYPRGYTSDSDDLDAMLRALICNVRNDAGYVPQETDLETAKRIFETYTQKGV